MALKRAVQLIAQAAVVVASTSYGNVLADIPRKDEIEVPSLSTTSNNNDNDIKDSEGTCDYGTNNDGTCSVPPTETAVARTKHLDECGVWLAPSSLPGAGLGIFAGKEFAKGEDLLPTGDVVIPIVDIMMHQKGRGRFPFLWDEYTWNGISLGIGPEVFKECNAASPGFGAAANSFLDLVNVEEGDPINDVPNGLHRSKDPGVGAFSTYHDRRTSAKVRIREGQELFVNYGQHWFEQRARLGPIPLRGGLKKSTAFYKKYQKLRSDNPQVEGAVFDELWDEFVKGAAWDDSRILGAFWHTPYEKEMLAKNWTLKQVRISEGTRSKQWLMDHGTCADHIREDISTIRQAGRGAFATRSLPKGAKVASLPLIQIIDKTVLEMYDLMDIKTKVRQQRRLVGLQLITNYCFGHTNSTMLLCPYGPIAGMVNHNQTRANVRLRWGDPKRSNHEPDMLDKTIEQFAQDRTAKLSMDLVAIRDIEPGEEVLLDYGTEWEEAWQNHVRNWKQEGSEDYVSAFMLNEKNTTVLRTEFDQIKDPYPGNVNIECDVNIWSRISQDQFETSSIVNITRPDNFKWWVCDLLRYRFVNDTIRYTVVATRPQEKKKKKKQKQEADKDEKKPEKYLKLTDIPRMAIRFTDRPYTTDMFLEQAFRHPILIPEDIFPDKWKNYSPLIEKGTITDQARITKVTVKRKDTGVVEVKY